MSLSVPSLGTAAVDLATGRFAATWVAFFRGLAAGAPPLEAPPVAASPMTYRAAAPGDLLVSGGAGVTVTLTRGRASIAVPPGFVPVSAGDVVLVGYTAPPALSFIPRVI